LYRLNWLSDFLAPICNLNKTLQASSYKLGDLWSDIQSSIDFLRSCYINNKKPPLSNSENLTIKRETEEIMKHHLSFSGFHLERFLSECKFINDKEAAYKYSDKQIISLRFERLQGMGLKFLVLDAAKFLLKELESIVPNKENFFKNFEVFNFKQLIGMTNTQFKEYGNEEMEIKPILFK